METSAAQMLRSFATKRKTFCATLSRVEPGSRDLADLAAESARAPGSAMQIISGNAYLARQDPSRSETRAWPEPCVATAHGGPRLRGEMPE